MSYQTVLSKALELAAAAQAAGALGAELRLRQLGVDGDPRVRAGVRRVVASIDPPALDDLEPGQTATVIAQLVYALQEALDLIREPDRAPGWTYEDPAILQERGKGSGGLVRTIATLASTRSRLASCLAGERRFLDIGTGVAWIAIEAARRWPELCVVGIDIWEPALKIAEENVAAEGFGDRVAIRRQNVMELEDADTFDVAWLPTMFLPRDVAEAVIPRLARALVPGGALLCGMFGAACGPHGTSVRDLLTIRCGGYPWTSDELTRYLRANGFDDVEYVALGSSTDVVVAHRTG